MLSAPAVARLCKSARNRYRLAQRRAHGQLTRHLVAGVTCGPGLLRGASVDFEIYGTLTLGRNVILADGCQLAVGPGATLQMGDNVYVGRGTVIVASERITIGAHTLIAEHCSIRDGDHQIAVDARRTETALERAPVTIDNDVWIGAGARILRGVHLQTGTVVAANAVVRQSFGPHQVIGGVPARLLRTLPSAGPR